MASVVSMREAMGVAFDRAFASYLGGIDYASRYQVFVLFVEALKPKLGLW
jgi:hypothetical protein